MLAAQARTPTPRPATLLRLRKAIAAAIDARIPLVNMSIAGPADPLLSALVQSGLKRGMIFVGSAADAGDAFPANINGVIGVGNSESDHRAVQHSPRRQPT